jgi:transposase
MGGTSLIPPKVCACASQQGLGSGTQPREKLKSCQHFQNSRRKRIIQSSQLYELLTSMPGVGPVLAFTLIALLPELGKMSRKQIAALVGLA